MVAERSGGDGGGSDAAADEGAPAPGADAVAAATPADATLGAELARADDLAERTAGLAEGLTTRLADRLGDDERVRVAWVVDRAGTAGSARQDEPRGDPALPTLYAATDRRLVAVETDRPVRSTPFARRSGDPALTLGTGVVVAVLSFLGGVAAASGWTALLLVVTCVGGLALAERGWHRWRAGEHHERSGTAISSVVVSGSPAGRAGGVGTGDGGEEIAGTGAVDGTGPTVTAFDVGGGPSGAVGGDDRAAGEEGSAAGEDD